jgi:hypothetical protein
MELELKILKEKVKEDEQDTGIGGMFDDEKTSHEHVTLLKTKYAAMRRDYEHRFNQLDKDKLETMGDKFQLEAQLHANKTQLKDMKKKYTEYVDEHNKVKFELEKKVKELQRSRLDLENEVRNLANSVGKSQDAHFSNDMYLQKDKAREEKLGVRHLEE